MSTPTGGEEPQYHLTEASRVGVNGILGQNTAVSGWGGSVLVGVRFLTVRFEGFCVVRVSWGWLGWAKWEVGRRRSSEALDIPNGEGIWDV